jgi:small nuclear ribonucleoprotein (snRNP)-like protein
MDEDADREFLATLLNKQMRILTTDGRIFRGSFKCTDPVRSIPVHPYL